MTERKSFTIRSENHPDCTLYADSYEDAGIKYCETYGHQGEITVEGDEYYVTFDVDFAGISEIDREQK